MRNTPLWRPQPSSGPAFDAHQESAGSGKRLSAAAMAGLGLTIAVGIGAVGVFAFFDDGPVESAAAAVPALAPPVHMAEVGLPEIAKREPLVGRVPAASATVQPPAGAEPATIDVAVAQNESDVARLEEMTGMVTSDPAEPVEEPRIAAMTDAGPVQGLRDTTAVPGAERVVVPAEPDAAMSEDGTITASIQPGEAAVPVEAGAAAQEPVAPAPALPPLGAAKVSRYVNLRSGPADESRVIVVVPAGATVQAQANCGWCAVTYKGQRGYIYKSFLGRGGATASNDAAPALNRSKPGLY